MGSAVEGGIIDMRPVGWRHACVVLLAAVWLGPLLLTFLPTPAFADGGASGAGAQGGADSTTGTGAAGQPSIVEGGSGGGAGATGGAGGGADSAAGGTGGTANGGAGGDG